MLKRNAALLLKPEGVYGTDSVPTGAANAILLKDLDWSPQEAKTVSRDVLRPFLGNSEVLPGTLFVKASFSVELAGSGAAGTAPAWGPILRICGWSQTVTAGVSVVYQMVSSNFESGTVYFHIDGVLHKATGVMCDSSIEFAEGGIPTIKFSLTGLYNVVVDAALPAAGLAAFQKPLPVNTTNTPTFTLHGVPSVLEKLSINQANAIVHRALPGAPEKVLITDRKPAGSVTIEAAKVATKDWWTVMKNAATGPMQIVHGVTAGNIIQVDAPAVQLHSPKYGDKDGVLNMSASLIFAPNAGNDEIVITVR